MNWQTVPLGTLADFRNGINYTKKNFGKGIKVINVRNFQDYSYATFDDLDEVNLIRVIKEEDLLKKNDIIFVRSNGNRQLIGRSLFVSDVKEKVVHSAFTIKVRFNSNKVIPRFYAYLFRTSLIRQTLSAHGSGTNISNLNQQILSNLPVPLPTLSTQNKIVNIISAYDDLIENNTRRIKILETMAQTLYQEWFVKFRFPGHGQVKMVESELGLIPESWEVTRLKNILKLTHGFAFKSSQFSTEETSHVLIRMGNFKENGGLQIERKVKYVQPNSFKDKYLLKPNDLVMAFSDVTRVGGIIGNVGFIPDNDKKYVLNQRVVKIDLPTNLKMFFYMYFNSEDFKNHCLSRADSATVLNLKNDHIYKHLVILPNKLAMSSFQETFEPIIKQIQLLDKKNINLRKTRDLLLPKLISGQIDVENLDIDTGELAA